MKYDLNTKIKLLNFMRQNYERWNIIIVLNVFTRTRYQIWMHKTFAMGFELCLCVYLCVSFWIESMACDNETEKCSRRSEAANQQIDICKHSRNKLLCMQRNRVKNLKWLENFIPPTYVLRTRCSRSWSVLISSRIRMEYNDWIRPTVRVGFDSSQSQKKTVISCTIRPSTCQLWEIRIFETIEFFRSSMWVFVFRFAFFHVKFVAITIPLTFSRRIYHSFFWFYMQWSMTHSEEKKRECKCVTTEPHSWRKISTPQYWEVWNE